MSEAKYCQSGWYWAFTFNGRFWQSKCYDKHLKAEFFGKQLEDKLHGNKSL